MPVLTKDAAEVFAPVNGSGAPRGADMGEVQVWGTEIESRLDNVDELPSFRAHKNGTDQTGVATATATKVTFATEVFDLGGYYDHSTSRYAPEAGKYQFVIQVTFSAAVVDQAQTGFYLYRNGALDTQFLEAASGTGEKGCFGCAIVDVAPGDYFEVYAYAAGSGDKTISGTASKTFFAAARLDSITGETGAQGPNVGLDYAFNTATSGDPGAGAILVDNATPASITQFNISETNRQGVSQAAFLALQDDSTASVKAIVRILDAAAPGENFIDLAITGTLTDVGGYDTFPVSYVGHGGTIANDAVVAVVFFRTGNNGTNGSNGSNGADGADPGILMTWDTGTTDADPGAGEIRANNASLASASVLYISKTSRAGSDIEAFLAALDDSTNTVKGTLVLTRTADEDQASFAVGAVTDATGYIKLAVSGHSGATGFSSADAVSFQFARAGDKGADGEVAGPVSSTVGNIAVFSSTDGNSLDDSGKALSTDGTFAANSDAKVPTEKAVKTYADALIAANDAMVFKGVIDCSANPNYPAADRGHTYRVSVAGKIGGGSGPNVEIGDILICLTDATSSGDQATVGSSWSIIQVNIDGALMAAGDAAVRAATAGNLGVTAAGIESASALVALTDAAPVAVDWDTGINFSLTVAASREIGNPTNGQPGTYRTILVQGDDATDRTITFGNQFLGAVPTITDCDTDRWYLLTIRCITSTHFAVSSQKVKGT